LNDNDDNDGSDISSLSEKKDNRKAQSSLCTYNEMMWTNSQFFFVLVKLPVRKERELFDLELIIIFYSFPVFLVLFKGMD